MLRIVQEGLTFDDVLLIPAQSQVLPNEADLKTRLTKNISIRLPLLSAAMDKVSEARFATALALEGGISFIHKNMSIDDQSNHVRQVKNYISANPGIDISRASLDKAGALLVGAAVGAAAGNEKRIAALVEAGVDVILVDSSHGHSEGVLGRIRETRQTYPDLEIIGGNVATAAGAISLVAAGASGVKVGIGPGSICTTRIVTGCGVPQLTAIDNASSVLESLGIPVIADGGIRFSGDISKAIAAGASSVMLGSLFAGADETPGESFEVDGKFYKDYRGMGSISAMQSGSSDRYFQSDNAKEKLVPEGVEARIEVKGSVASIVTQLTGGLRSAMGLTGSATIEDLRTKGQFVRISAAGIKESHVHNVEMTKESPNYKGK